MNRIMIGRWILGFALLGGLIIWVDKTVGWPALLAPWRDFESTEFAWLLLLTTLSYVLRAVRIYEYLRPLLKGAFIGTLRLTLLHNALNNFLPMRLGELSFPVLMKRYFGQEYIASGMTLIWLRVFDLHVLGLSAWIFLAWIHAQKQWLYFIPVWLALIPGVYFIHARIRRRMLYINSRWTRLFMTAMTYTPEQFALFMRIWLWTALSWLCKLFAYTAVVRHFSAIDLGRAVLGTLGAELSSILPIHGVAGAGTYELAMSTVLLPLGISMASILKAAVNVHLYLLGTSLVLGFGALLLPCPRTTQLPSDGAH